MKLVITAALVASILTIGGVAGAAIVQNGVVNACYYSGTGNLRVDGDGICPSGQKPIKLAQGGVTPSSTEVLTWKPTIADPTTDRIFPQGTKIAVLFQQYGGSGGCEVVVSAAGQEIDRQFTGDDGHGTSPTVTLANAGPLTMAATTEPCGWDYMVLKVTITEPQGVLS